ncbi:hypothetical protein MNBD_GAMMA07-583 [hydrothermal vent metagenome]|uniref:Uncharacterized protein n=1 Tax=hydrothermal vent metagenome TaxID=652676 RepID=A0A3B0XK17_9ZZZZ
MHLYTQDIIDLGIETKKATDFFGLWLLKFSKL